MTDLVILDPDHRGVLDKLTARYGARNACHDGLFQTFTSARELEGRSPGVLLLTPEASRAVFESPVSCGILIISGDAETPSGVLNAGSVVTYGMSPKNTLTYSSIGEDFCVIALQRELVTAAGDVLERQEIKVEGGMHPELLLCVTAAALVLGIGCAAAAVR